MQINSVAGLKQAIEQTPHYKAKRPTEQLVLIDKCNFVINSIVEGNRHIWNKQDFKPIPLHSSILKSQLGDSEYKKILQMLVGLNYIHIDNNYISSPFVARINNKRKAEGKEPKPIKAESKKYALTHSAKQRGIIKVGVLSKRMEKKLVKHKTDLIKTYLLDKQIHSKIIFNLTELHFNSDSAKVNQAMGEFSNTTTTDSDKEKYYRENYNTLLRFNDFRTIEEYSSSPEFYYNARNKVNRVFHYFTTIPKPFRESLSLKSGEGLSEIDLKNSQPLIIALNYINKVFTLHNNRREEREKDIRGGICGVKSPHPIQDAGLGINSCLSASDVMLFEDVLAGNFYKRVADQAKVNGDLEFYNLFQTDYSSFKAEVLGKGLYFNLVPENEMKPAEKYLMQLYPNFLSFIREEKKEGFEAVSIKAQLIESSMFIQDLFIGLEHGTEFAVPVHDSIIVKSVETDYFLSKLVAILKTKFPYLTAEQIEHLFRITHY